MKNLPKLRVAREGREGREAQVNLSVEPMQRTDKLGVSGQDRSFASRKHPRYYKSYAVTPSNEDSSSAVEVSITGESAVRSRVPVSEGLIEFNGKS